MRSGDGTRRLGFLADSLVLILKHLNDITLVRTVACPRFTGCSGM